MDSKLSVSIITFGCKVNQVDAAWLAEELSASFQITDRARLADIYPPWYMPESEEKGEDR